jgi:hypothetical protein
MAKKKKSDNVIIDMPGTIGSAKILAPTIVKGSHLTVTTYPDGRTDLEWDDEALLRDVREALANHKDDQSTQVEDKPKRTRKKKV